MPIGAILLYSRALHFYACKARHTPYEVCVACFARIELWNIPMTIVPNDLPTCGPCGAFFNKKKSHVDNPMINTHKYLEFTETHLIIGPNIIDNGPRVNQWAQYAHSICLDMRPVSALALVLNVLARRRQCRHMFEERMGSHANAINTQYTIGPLY